MDIDHREFTQRIFRRQEVTATCNLIVANATRGGISYLLDVTPHLRWHLVRIFPFPRTARNCARRNLHRIIKQAKKRGLTVAREFLPVIDEDDPLEAPFYVFLPPPQ